MPSRTSTTTGVSTTLVLVVGMLVSGNKKIIKIPSPPVVIIESILTRFYLTGVCNTILNKYQDMQCVGNCEDPDPKNRHYFEQPIWQT